LFVSSSSPSAQVRPKYTPNPTRKEFSDAERSIVGAEMVRMEDAAGFLFVFLAYCDFVGSFLFSIYALT